MPRRDVIPLIIICLIFWRCHTWIEQGNAYDRYTDESFLTWLKTYRKSREEGYLKDDIFLDNRTQMEEKIANGRYFCMLYQRTDMADQQKILYREESGADLYCRG